MAQNPSRLRDGAPSLCASEAVRLFIQQMVPEPTDCWESRKPSEKAFPRQQTAFLKAQPLTTIPWLPTSTENVASEGQKEHREQNNLRKRLAGAAQRMRKNLFNVIYYAPSVPPRMSYPQLPRRPVMHRVHYYD